MDIIFHYKFECYDIVMSGDEKYRDNIVVIDVNASSPEEAFQLAKQAIKRQKYDILNIIIN